VIERWRLAVDFGTVFTTTAIARQDRAELVDVEGDGTFRMRSGVLLEPEGTIAVGEVARHAAEFSPERFEPTPKRSIGDGSILLGDRMLPIVEVISAVYVKVASKARRCAGGEPPDQVFLTHPADWAQQRIQMLVDAASAAGLGSPVMVPEPVAAAAHIGTATAPVGSHVAIYDFGGGTFDAAVLQRTATGYEVAGPPGGRDPLGGEDIDQRIIDHLGAGPLGELDGWHLLLAPPDARWRRAAAAFREAVRKAKEGLSTTLSWQLWVPGLECDVQLTRAELDDLIRSDVAATVDILAQTIAAAEQAARDLQGIYLVGGSSRIPLIADTIWKRLGVQPQTYDDPKAVVVLGAAERAPTPEPAPRLGLATTRFTMGPPLRLGVVAPAAAGAGDAAAGRPRLRWVNDSAARATPWQPPPAPFVAPTQPAPVSVTQPVQPAWGPPPPSPRPGPAPATPFVPPAAVANPAAQGRTMQAALAALVAAIVVVASLLLFAFLRHGSGSTSTTSTSSSTTSSVLADAQLSALAPAAGDFGSGFTSGTGVPLSALQLCGQAPSIVGVSAESDSAAVSGSAGAVADIAQFEAGRAGSFIGAQSGILSACHGTWTTTDPSNGQQLSVAAQEIAGAQIGDQTFRVEAVFTDRTGGTSTQDLVLTRSGDVLVIVAYQDTHADMSRVEDLASSLIDKVRGAQG
jgi:molecular chaperone DnaK